MNISVTSGSNNTASDIRYGDVLKKGKQKGDNEGYDGDDEDDDDGC